MLNLMTEQEVSKRLNVSVASLRRWRLLSRGPQFIKVGALVRYRPEDLDEWLTTLPSGGKCARIRQISAVRTEQNETAAYLLDPLATTN
jgi:excisionase family DNA binding protein